MKYGVSSSFLNLVIINAINASVESKIRELAVLSPELCFKRRYHLVRNSVHQIGTIHLRNCPRDKCTCNVNTISLNQPLQST
jgi:hypothetical protein